MRSGGVAPHLLTCSGFVKTSKTRAIGASNSRVMPTSSSLGKVMIAEPCRSGVTVVSLSLQLGEVVLDPIQSVVDRPLVLGHPGVQGLELVRGQAVEPVTAFGSAPDESDLTEHSQVPGDVRLRHRDLANDRPD